MNKYNFNLSFMVAYADDNNSLTVDDFDFENMPCEVEARSYEEAKDMALASGHEIIRFLDRIGVVAYMRVEKN
jgi:hypothetical protein